MQEKNNNLRKVENKRGKQSDDYKATSEFNDKYESVCEREGVFFSNLKLDDAFLKAVSQNLNLDDPALLRNWILKTGENEVLHDPNIDANDQLLDNHESGKNMENPSSNITTPESFMQELQEKFDVLSELRSIIKEKKAVNEPGFQPTSMLNILCEGMDVISDSKISNDIKIEVLSKKWSFLINQFSLLEKNAIRANSEKEAFKNDYETVKLNLAKVTAAKQKLESNCIELQNENRKIKEESKKLSLAEYSKREELALKFEKAIIEISSRLNQKEEISGDYDNYLLRSKFKAFLEQYEIRENHFHAVLRSKDLEVEEALMKYHNQKILNEQETLKVESLKAEVISCLKSENELKKQVTVYAEKFKQVEETLTKSNELFTTFRKEMEQMSKKVNILERENHQMKAKCDILGKNILDMADEKSVLLKNNQQLKNQKDIISNLARALRSEKNHIIGLLDKYKEKFGNIFDSDPAVEICISSEETPKNCSHDETSEN